MRRSLTLSCEGGNWTALVLWWGEGSIQSKRYYPSPSSRRRIRLLADRWAWSQDASVTGQHQPEAVSILRRR